MHALPLLALLTARPALPCANLVHDTGTLAESDAQEVILSGDASGSTVEYRIRYEGDAADFGWIIALPAGFVSLTDGDDTRFDQLAQHTAPTVEVYSFGGGGDDDGPGCGCADNAKGGDGGADTAGGRDLGVDIVAEGFSGTYDYTVITADDAAGLATWLSDNGWSAGSTQPSLDAYVSEGGIEFVLVRLAPDTATTPAEGRSLPPVRIETTAPDLRFPASMAEHAGPTEFRTVVYVLGDQRARVSAGWTQVEASWHETSGGQTPEEAYSDLLWENAGDSPVYTVVYAGAWGGGDGEAWVTRFETRALASAHTADAWFAVDEGEVGMGLVIEDWSESGGWVLVPLLGVGWLGRRRRR